MGASSALVLVNRMSGTVRSRGAEAVAALVQEQLAAVFSSLDVRLFEGDITPHVKAAKGKFDVLIAGGGDGTIASAAAELLESDTILGALPLGTMNLFVQALGFSPKLEEALAQFATAHVSAIDVGLANDRVFLHQVSFGLQPRMAKLREKLGYRSRMGKMMGAARALVTLAARPRLVRINVELDGETLKVSAPMVAVTNNPIGSDKNWSVQHRLDGGVLGYYALTDISLRSLLHLARGYLRNRLHDDDIVDNRTAHQVVIKRRPQRINFKKRKGILASMDGEVVVLSNPVQVSMKRAALKVMEV